MVSYHVVVVYVVVFILYDDDDEKKKKKKGVVVVECDERRWWMRRRCLARAWERTRQSRLISNAEEASRRSVVLQTIGACVALMVSSGIATDAFAADMATSLPKDYTDKLRLACEQLLNGRIERDHPSASISERFAAADPAKQAVKDYIQTWQGRPETKDLETSTITGEVLRELARYYYKKNCSQVAR